VEFSKKSMGAGSSVRMVYNDALTWFRAYIDTETYVIDFDSIDKDSDGTISYVEFMNWISMKARGDARWQVFLNEPQVLAIAHKNASRIGKKPQKIVDFTDFKVLLLNLFATSILWTHFVNADSWVGAADVGNKQLNFEEFKLACETLCSTHAGEKINDDQLRQDFDLLDTNMSNSVSFVEVCNYCCNFVDDIVNRPSQKVPSRPDLFEDYSEPSSANMGTLKSLVSHLGSAVSFEAPSPNTRANKSSDAVDALALRMEVEKRIAKSIADERSETFKIESD